MREGIRFIRKKVEKVALHHRDTEAQRKNYPQISQMTQITKT
jgi:hypothetical protein